MQVSLESILSRIAEGAGLEQSLAGLAPPVQPGAVEFPFAALLAQEQAQILANTVGQPIVLSADGMVLTDFDGSALPEGAVLFEPSEGPSLSSGTPLEALAVEALSLPPPAWSGTDEGLPSAIAALMQALSTESSVEPEQSEAEEGSVSSETIATSVTSQAPPLLSPLAAVVAAPEAIAPESVETLVEAAEPIISEVEPFVANGQASEQAVGAVAGTQVLASVTTGLVDGVLDGDVPLAATTPLVDGVLDGDVPLAATTPLVNPVDSPVEGLVTASHAEVREGVEVSPKRAAPAPEMVEKSSVGQLEAVAAEGGLKTLNAGVEILRSDQRAALDTGPSVSGPQGNVSETPSAPQTPAMPQNPALRVPEQAVHQEGVMRVANANVTLPSTPSVVDASPEAVVRPQPQNPIVSSGSELSVSSSGSRAAPSVSQGVVNVEMPVVAANSVETAVEPARIVQASSPQVATRPSEGVSVSVPAAKAAEVVDAAVAAVKMTAVAVKATDAVDVRAATVKMPEASKVSVAAGNTVVTSTPTTQAGALAPETVVTLSATPGPLRAAVAVDVDVGDEFEPVATARNANQVKLAEPKGEAAGPTARSNGPVAAFRLNTSDSFSQSQKGESEPKLGGSPNVNVAKSGEGSTFSKAFSAETLVKGLFDELAIESGNGKPPGSQVEFVAPSREAAPEISAEIAKLQATPGAAPKVGDVVTASPASEERAATRPTLDTMREFMVKNVRYLLSQGGKTIKVRLVPASLGELHLEVTTTESGLGVRLASANPVVREALQGQLQGLTQALAREGIEVSNVTVSADLPSGSNASGNGGRAAQGSGNSSKANGGSEGSYRNGGRDSSAPEQRHGARSSTLDLFA